MRIVLAILGLLAIGAVPARAADDCVRPRSASMVTAWRPRAWTPPPSMVVPAPGIRFEPETGEAPLPTDLQALGAARREALSRVQVITRPDGSRYAVLGGLIRSYSVLHLDAEGHWVEECVGSDEQARARVRETSSSAKTGP